MLTRLPLKNKKKRERLATLKVFRITKMSGFTTSCTQTQYIVGTSPSHIRVSNVIILVTTISYTWILCAKPHKVNTSSKTKKGWKEEIALNWSALFCRHFCLSD